ncbi:histidine kinase, partial [Streptomyces sp. NPDC006875]
RYGTPGPDQVVPALPKRVRRPSTPTAGTGPGSATPAEGAEPGTNPLPRRIRQTHLAPQLKDGPERRGEREGTDELRGPAPADRDAEEVRDRMASLQRGWRRGREENAAGDQAQDGTAPGTTEGDGR